MIDIRVYGPPDRKPSPSPSPINIGTQIKGDRLKTAQLYGRRQWKTRWQSTINKLLIDLFLCEIDDSNVVELIMAQNVGQSFVAY